VDTGSLSFLVCFRKDGNFLPVATPAISKLEFLVWVVACLFLAFVGSLRKPWYFSLVFFWALFWRFFVALFWAMCFFVWCFASDSTCPRS